MGVLGGGQNGRLLHHLLIASTTMTPDSVHLLTRFSQMSLFRDGEGRIRRAYYGARLHEPEDAFSDAGSAPLLYATLADSLTGLPNASGEYDICVTQPDGALSLCLACERQEVTQLDEDREEAVFYLKDPAYPVRVEVHVRAHRESGVFTQWAVIRHEGDGPIRIHRAASGHLKLRAERYFVTSFRGTWGGESLMSEEEVARGHELSLTSGTGTRAAQEGSPGFIISLDGAAREDAGEVILGALAWPGNYRIWFRHSPYHYLHAGAGMDMGPGPYVLDAGGVLETPPLILAHSGTGKGEASRRLHRWARRYGLRGGNTERWTLLNSWEGVYFTFTEEMLHAMMKRTADLGIELFVLDDGWFGNRFPRNDARAGLGDWQVNRTKLPGGLDGLIRTAEKLGIRFGIWVEPEMVNPQSELFLNHPDWVIGLPHRENRLERSQYLLDLSNPDVRGYILDAMRKLLGEHPGISYVKWDCNRKISDPGSTWLDARHQGNLAIDYVHGYEAVLDALAAEFPHVVFQACSSGGGRADYGTMRRHHEFWTSDNTDACERVFMQWGIGHLFPAIAMASHVTASPNHQTGRATPLKFRFDAAMSGRLGFELQPCDMTKEDMAFSRYALAEYKRIRPVIQFGDLYRLSSPYESRVASLMYVHEGRAVVFAWLMDKWLADAPPPLRLKGLDPAARYLLRELNMDENGSLTHVHEHVLGGDFLMNAGIRINWKKMFQSVCLEVAAVTPS